MPSPETILITGGLGYLGSHAVVAFEQAGYKTIILDNLSNTTLKQHAGIEKILGYAPTYYQVDISDKRALDQIFSQHNIHGVIHFAGLKAVGESCEQPFHYYHNNVTGSLTLFEIMEKHSVRKLLFSSSATVYKAHETMKNRGIQEGDQTGGTTNPYGTTKHLLEQIINDLVKHKGWSATNLRYFNPVGAHPTGFIGENPQGTPNNLLPYIFQVATEQRSFVGIFGNDYDTPDGTGVRDYIDVNDLINGHILAYQKMNQTPSLCTYNLGTGEGVSVLEMITSVSSITGKKIPHRILPRRSGDLATVYADATLAYKKLGRKTRATLDESLINGRKFIQNCEQSKQLKENQQLAKSRLLHTLYSHKNDEKAIKHHSVSSILSTT